MNVGASDSVEQRLGAFGIARFHEDGTRGGYRVGPLRGREPACRAVHDGLTDAARGRGAVLLVGGEPGSGKSEVLRLAAEQAGTHGLQVAADLGDDLRSAAQRHDRLAGLTADIRTREKTVIVLDDLHRLDAVALGAFRELRRQSPANRHLWLLAADLRPGGNGVDRLFAAEEANGARYIALPSLDEPAVAGLVGDLIGRSPSAELLELSAQAGGNPLLLVALVRGLREEGRLGDSDGPLYHAAPLPDFVHRVTRRYLGEMSGPAGEMLRAVAVLGPGFTPEQGAALLGRTPGQMIGVWEEAMAAGVLEARAEEFAFRHELFRRAIVEGLPAPIHRALRRYAEGVSAGPSVIALAPSEDAPESTETRLLRALATGRGLENAIAEASAIVAQDGEINSGPYAAATACMCLARWRAGRLAEAVGFGRRALLVADTGARGRRTRIQIQMLLAAQLLDAGAIEEAHEAVGLLHDEIGNAGDSPWTATPAILRSRVELARGHHERALEEAVTGLRLATAGHATSLVPAAAAALVGVHLRSGDVGAAARLLSVHQVDLVGAGVRSGLVAARLQAAQRTGPVNLLDDLLDRLWDEPSAILAQSGHAGWLMRACLESRRDDLADAVMEITESLAAHGEGYPRPAAVAAHARGLSSGDLDTLRRAAHAYTDVWESASAIEDLAKTLNDAGRSSEAVEALGEAHDTYQRIGAAEDAARTRHRLRGLGVRRRHWRHVDRPPTGWASLTDTQRSVGELVAQGLTNRQAGDRLYLSAHTVAFHLRHIYRKLGITSRVELARIVAGQTDDDR